MVEDERFLAEAEARILKKNNYDVDISYDGEDGYYNALSGIYDAILLDIMLPKMDGLTVLRKIREEGIKTPVILLTAKGELEDKVEGLDSGADDYLAKPFKSEELLARIRAVTRRRGDLAQNNLLSLGDIEYNPNTLVLTGKNESFNLTKKEGALLEYLLLNKGASLSPESIIEKIWGYDSDAEDNHVQVYISFLRKKLAGTGSRVKIKTIRNVGYAIVDEAGSPPVGEN